MKFGSTGRFAIAACAAAAFSVGAYAQDTAGTAGQRADADRDRDRMVTVTGCVFQEQQVPGRDATLFQRWGLTQQDFVLTNVRPQPGAQVGQQQPGQPGYQQPGQQPAQQPGQQPGQAGQPGQPGQAAPAGQQHAPMTAENVLRIEGKEAEQLRKYQGQQVEVRGRLDDAGWYERAMRHDRERDQRDAAARPGEQPRTGEQPRPGEQPTGTAGPGVATGTGTGVGTGATTVDRQLTSIEVESIRAIGPCPQQQHGEQHHPRPQQQQPSPQP